jgi:hypothetical protein
VLGAVERAQKCWHEAESDLSRSIGIWGELKNAFEQARAEFEVALLYREQGMELDAHALLERCLDTFMSFGVEPYRTRVQEALGSRTQPALPAVRPAE